MSRTIHLRYPFHELRAGIGVLSAALSLFGPSDAVELLLSPTDGLPTEEQLEGFRRLRAELSLPYGPPARMRLVDGPSAEATPAMLRLTVTGDPVEDARSILALGSVGRQFGSAYGASGGWLRGPSDLARTELDAAFAQRSLRAGRRSDAKIRVVVMVQRIQVWSAVDPIVRAGLEHSEVELDVVLMPEERSSFQQHDRSEIEAFVAQRGAKLRDDHWLRAHAADVDVLIVPDPYITRANTAPGLSPLELAASGVRVVLAPYAQALSGSPANLAMLHNQPLHNMAWLLFAPSRGALANFERRCAAGTGHIRYVGSAKRERLLADPDAAARASELRQRLRTRSVVLWNPHFVGDRELSTFDELAEPILSYFVEHRGLGLVVRPHPRLFAEFIASGMQKTVDDFRGLIGRMPNAVLDESMDATPALLAADAMISDLSSLIVEYHVLGRPIGWLRPDPDVALNEDREWLDITTPIDGTRDLVRFLDRIRAAKRAPDRADSQEDLGTGARIIETIVTEFRRECDR